MRDTILDGPAAELLEGTVEKVRCFIAHADARYNI